ncbi:MAG: hypothetical protein RLZZ142_1444, partial [Verrucomicrobiota bacterium]
PPPPPPPPPRGFDLDFGGFGDLGFPLVPEDCFGGDP